MPIPCVKAPPPPPRRAPPAAHLVQEVSVATFVTADLQMKLSGVAITSQQLIQIKDAMNDIKVTLAAVEETIHRITTNPALLGASPGDGTRGGVDIQSLQFAAATRGKLSEQEAKQDAHYASLREYDTVGQEVRKATQDPSLLRYREEAECQLASSAFPGAHPPRSQTGTASRPVPPEERQTLLKPFATVHRQPESSALTASDVCTNNNSRSSVYTAPYRSSDANGGRGGTATAPPAAHVHAAHAVPTQYSQAGGATSGVSQQYPMTTQPPSNTGNRFRPNPTPSAMPQPHEAFPPTVTPAAMAGGGGYPPSGGAGHYGASPYPATQQGQPRPVYGSYGQQQPSTLVNPQSSGRLKYMAL